MSDQTPDDVTLGELYRSMKSLENKVDGYAATAVLRGEYETRLAGIDREIRDIKADQATRRVSWPTMGALVVAAMALLVTIIPLIANG